MKQDRVAIIERSDKISWRDLYMNLPEVDIDTTAYHDKVMVVPLNDPNEVKRAIKLLGAYTEPEVRKGDLHD